MRRVAGGGPRFGEIATGSFGVTVPENLIHIDINPAVFDANYPARIKIVGDPATLLTALLAEMRARRDDEGGGTAALMAAQIARDKQAYRAEWLAHNSNGRVNPARFFDALRRQMPDDAITVVDDGNHTYLTAELFPILRDGRLIVPTDLNAMGYAVPAAIGARLACPERDVFAIVGDGAFMMSGLEIVTAAMHGLPIVCYVFSDGELSQIAQAQEIPYNHKPFATLDRLNLEGLAQATGTAFVRLTSNDAIEGSITEARKLAAAGQPVIVDVTIDYSKRTAFTQGTVKTNFLRLPLTLRLRMAARALQRRLTG